jgi:hypothetical protein
VCKRHQRSGHPGKENSRQTQTQNRGQLSFAKGAKRRVGTGAINPNPVKTSGRNGRARKTTTSERSGRKLAPVIQEVGEYIVVDTGSIGTAESVDERGGAPSDRVAGVIVSDSESKGPSGTNTSVASCQATGHARRISKSAPRRPKQSRKVCREGFEDGDLNTTTRITQPVLETTPTVLAPPTDSLKEMRPRNGECLPQVDAVSIDAGAPMSPPKPNQRYDQVSASAWPGRAIPQPPAITFTTDNGFKTALSQADINLFFRIFSKNAQVLLRSKPTPTQGRIYPVEALMTQTSADFYKWYTAASETDTGASVTKFHLMDAAWYSEGTFLVPGGDLQYFQLLKQIIWNSFWLTLSSNKTSTPFHVLGSHGDNIQYDSWQAMKLPVEGTAPVAVSNCSTTTDAGLKTALNPHGLAEPQNIRNHVSSLPLNESTQNFQSSGTITHDLSIGAACLPQNLFESTPAGHLNCTTENRQTNGSTTCLSMLESCSSMSMDISLTADALETPLPSIKDLHLLPVEHKSTIHDLLHTSNE